MAQSGLTLSSAALAEAMLAILPLQPTTPLDCWVYRVWIYPAFVASFETTSNRCLRFIIKLPILRSRKPLDPVAAVQLSSERAHHTLVATIGCSRISKMSEPQVPVARISVIHPECLVTKSVVPQNLTRVDRLRSKGSLSCCG